LTTLAIATFLAFGTLLVLFGANASEIITSLDLDYADFGLLGSVLSIGLGTGIVVAGPASDRLSRRWLYIGSCLVVIVAATTIGPDTTYQRLIVHMIVIGLGAGFYETVLNATVVEDFPDTAARRLLFIHSGAPLAACIVPLLIAVVRETTSIQWYETFRIAGFMHLPLMLAACFVTMDFSRPVRPERESNTHCPESVPSVDHLAFIAICATTFTYVGVETALTMFVVDHATTDLGLPAVRAARAISAFWGGLFVGRLAAGLSPQSPGAGMTAFFAAIAAAILLLFESGLFGSAEIAMVAIGLALGGVFPVMIGLAGRAHPSSPAIAVGLAGGLGSAGGFVVPWATGGVASTLGLPFAMTTLAGWILLLSVAAAIVHLRRPRSKAVS